MMRVVTVRKRLCISDKGCVEVRFVYELKSYSTFDQDEAYVVADFRRKVIRIRVLLLEAICPQEVASYSLYCIGDHWLAISEL